MPPQAPSALDAGTFVRCVIVGALIVSAAWMVLSAALQASALVLACNAAEQGVDGRSSTATTVQTVISGESAGRERDVSTGLNATQTDSTEWVTGAQRNRH